ARILQCSTSMMGAFEAAGLLTRGGHALAMVGGVESMSRVQVGLGQNLSDWLRRFGAARTAKRKLGVLRALRPRDIRLYLPEVKNRATGKSMGEHCEEMAREWKRGPGARDELAFRSPQKTTAARDAGFSDALIEPVDGVSRDAFPRRDTSMEKLSALKPAFDRARGTLTAGNS